MWWTIRFPCVLSGCFIPKTLKNFSTAHISKDSSSPSLLVNLPPRTTVREVSRESLQWYPGHINKGIVEINRQLTSVQCIIEVHDARIPLTGRSSLLSRLGQVRPKILILNKADLTDRKKLLEMLPMIQKRDEMPPYAVFLASFKSPEVEKRTIGKIMSCVHDILEAECTSPSIKAHIMVCGIPNVGKSTTINALRSWCIRQGQLLDGKKSAKSVARVGRNPGMTRQVGQPFVLCSRRALVYSEDNYDDVYTTTAPSSYSEVSSSPNNLVYMYDSPGILEPRYQDIETLLKLGVCNCLNLDQADVVLLVDYLLYWFNVNKQFQYVEKYHLKEPTDDLVQFLTCIALSKGLTVTRRVEEIRRGINAKGPDLRSAAHVVLRDLSSGALGCYLFDTNILDDDKLSIPFKFLK